MGDIDALIIAEDRELYYWYNDLITHFAKKIGLIVAENTAFYC